MLITPCVPVSATTASTVVDLEKKYKKKAAESD